MDIYLHEYAVNTFTEHHGGNWSVKDMQHTYGFAWSLFGILLMTVTGYLAFSVWFNLRPHPVTF